MWLGVLVALSAATTSWSQRDHASQQLQQSGSNFEWGWQLTPVEQYYIQPVHQFAGGVDVLQDSTPLTPTNVPLQPAQAQLYQNTVNQTQAATIHAISEQAPFDVFLLHQQFPFSVLRTLHSDLPSDLIQYTNIPHNLFNSNTFTQTGYNIQTEHPSTNKNIEDVKRIDTADNASSLRTETEFVTKVNNLPIDPIVQVFKDHNCTKDELETTKEYNSSIQKTSEIDANVPTYNEHNVNDNFGARDPKETSLYKAAANFKIETRANTKNEGYYYYSTETAPTTGRYRYDDLDGISRLVASTQDLISNDDLLRINHSVEKQVPDISDDYLKPRPRYNSRTETSQYYQNPKHTITVKAKIRNIENKPVVHSDARNEEVLENNNKSDKFTSPIVVQDSNENDYEEQILNTLVSTMTPYIENGYQISSITKNTEPNANIYVPQYPNQNMVHVTPRPIGIKYLAPLTVALRLLNSNHTEVLNSVDDHDVSDSELVEKTVRSPFKERTVVEIQESIPVDITHINDVEVHQYWDIDPSNSNPLDVANSLYNTYMEAQVKKKNENINELLKNTSVENSNGPEVNDDNEHNNYESSETDKLEPSENMQAQVSVHFNNFNSNGNKNENYYDKLKENDRKVVQSIVIEKEVPVPQYVSVNVPYPVEQKVYIDRPVHVPYPVEKQVVRTVPVPTPVAVPIKEDVPIGNPVHLPVFIEKPVPVGNIVHKEVPVPYPVEKKVFYPVPYEKTVHVPYPVEKRIPVPVETIVEKPVPVTQIVEKPVHVPVPVPVHIVKHYPVDRFVEKKVPVIFPVDRIVEKKVSVRVPYPIEKVVEKIVEKPVVVTKYVDKPYLVETKVPYIVEKVVEKKVPYAVQVPYVGQESQTLSQYQQYEGKQSPSSNSVRSEQEAKALKDVNIDQYHYYLKDKQLQNTLMIPIQITKWGNLYASTYKHVNVTLDNLPQNSQTNIHNTNSNSYYGPPPMQSSGSVWAKNAERNSGRAERTPKVTTLRIEYGGFKPPLIPSMEVDLDGRPINKASES